jgi:hypothetical protein
MKAVPLGEGSGIDPNCITQDDQQSPGQFSAPLKPLIRRHFFVFVDLLDHRPLPRRQNLPLRRCRTCRVGRRDVVSGG